MNDLDASGFANKDYPISTFRGFLIGGTVNKKGEVISTYRTIKNLIVTVIEGRPYTGLFENISEAHIGYIILDNLIINGSKSSDIQIGGIAGYAVASTLTHIIVKGKIYSGHNCRVGGVLGEAFESYLDTIVSQVNILNTGKRGAYNGELPHTIGGLVGRLKNSILINSVSYQNTLSSTGKSLVGGLVGVVSWDNSQSQHRFKNNKIKNNTVITNNISSGQNSKIGLLIGDLEYGKNIINSNYWYSDTLKMKKHPIIGNCTVKNPGHEISLYQFLRQNNYFSKQLLKESQEQKTKEFGTNILNSKYERNMLIQTQQ